MKRILVITGPTIGFPAGKGTAVGGGEEMDAVNEQLRAHAAQCGISCEFYHSNHEGDLVDALQRARREMDGVVLNAGGYSHYSYVIRDAAALLTIPCVEVHMSNIYAMGERSSIIAPVCAGSVAGFGKYSYFLAVTALKYIFEE